jgi:protein-disulfide isomerase
MHRGTPALVIFVAMLVVSVTSACTAQSAADVQVLETEVSALKEEVATLRKELDEVLALAPIKALIAENRPIDVSMSVAGSPTVGAETAKLTLVEFSDFQCPYCGRHVTDTYPSLKSQYVETGKMKYVFRDYPLANHKLAPKAAEAAHCAGEQDRFWEMHDALFANQRALQPEQLPVYASNVGVADPLAFQECLDSGRFASQVEAGLREGQRLRVTGTPSFGIGYTSDDGNSVRIVKVLRGALPLPQFQAAIDELLDGEPPVEGSN